MGNVTDAECRMEMARMTPRWHVWIVTSIGGALCLILFGLAMGARDTAMESRGAIAVSSEKIANIQANLELIRQEQEKQREILIRIDKKVDGGGQR